MAGCLCITGCDNHKKSEKFTKPVQQVSKNKVTKKSKYVQPKTESAQLDLEVKSKLPPALVRYMEAALKNNKEIDHLLH